MHFNLSSRGPWDYITWISHYPSIIRPEALFCSHPQSMCQSSTAGAFLLPSVNLIPPGGADSIILAGPHLIRFTAKYLIQARGIVPLSREYISYPLSRLLFLYYVGQLLQYIYRQWHQYLPQSPSLTISLSSERCGLNTSPYSC